MVNLAELKTKPALIKDGILFDLKRSGDYEQANAAKIVSNELGNVVLVTIDILCSVYARCIHQPVIRHLNETLQLYRFDKQSSVDKEISELIQIKFKTLKLIQNLTLVKNVVENKMINELADFHQQCKSFIESGKYYLPSSIKYLKTGYVQSTPEIIVESLLKHKLVDILNMFQTVKIKVMEFKSYFDKVNVDAIETDLQSLNELVNTFGTEIDKQVVKTYIETNNVITIIQKYEIQSVTGTTNTEFVVVDQINKLIQTISSAFSLTNAQTKILNQGLSILGLNVILTENINGTLCWTYSNEITSVKLYVKKYNELCNSLYKMERVLDRPRHPPFNTVLMDSGYYTHLNAIYSMYIDTRLGESVYNLFSPSQLSDESIVEWYKSLPQQINKLKPSINKMKTYALRPPPAQKTKRGRDEVEQPIRTRARYQGGNDTSVYQYIDLNDLLADICSQSAAYLESTMTEYMKQHRVQSLFRLRSKSFGGIIHRTTIRSRSRSKKSMLIKSGTLRKTIRQPTTQSHHVSQFIDYLIQSHHSEISELMEKMAYQFEMGLVSLKHNMDELYVYEPSDTELYLLCVLSMNREKSTENIMYPIEQTHYIFGNIDTSRFNVRLNDVYTKYAFADHIPPEIVNILVFTLVDNLMQTNKQGYFNQFILDLATFMKQKQVNGRSFETKRDWSRVIDIVYVLIHCVTNNQFIPPREVLQIMFQGGNKNS
jgi:hypothetical protein